MPLLALMDDLILQVMPLEKVVVVNPDPDFSSLSAEAIVDAVSGTYIKCDWIESWIEEQGGRRRGGGKSIDF